MAAVTKLGTQTFNTTSGTHTVVATPAVGDLIVIITASTSYNGSTAPTDNNSDGFGTYALGGSTAKNSSADQLAIYVRNNLVGSATSTTFSHAPGTTTGGGLVVLKVTGMPVAGSAAVRQSSQNSDIAGATVACFGFASAFLSTNPIIGAVFNATNPATITPPTNYTESVDVGYATPATGLEVITRDSGETASSLTWGGTSASVWCVSVVELNTAIPIPVSDSTSTSENVSASITGGSPSNLTVTVSDSTSTSENLVPLQTSFINVSDTTTTSESVNETLVFNAKASDSSTVSENKSASFPLMETLKDDYEFGGNDTGKWNTWGGGSASATTNLVAEITTTTGGTYTGYLSNQYYNLTGSYAFQQLTDAGNQSITSLEVYPIELSNGSNALSVMISGNTVYARNKISGSYTTVGSTVAYNSTTMKWFRVRESGGTTYWEYAADPTSTWTIIAFAANPIAVTALIGGFTVGTWQAEGSTTVAKFDNFNVLPGENQFPWNGYTFNKRIHAGDPASMQAWDAANVTGPDGSNYVHVNLANPLGYRPSGSEIFSATRGFGYGTYTAVIGTELDNVGHPVGFGGMFTFDFTASPDYKEIDVHETRDYNSNPNKRILHSHVYNNGGVRAFIVDDMDVPSNVVQTHVMTWTATSITFDSYLGTGTGGTNFFHTVHSTHVPTPGLERVHFNVFVDTSITGYAAAAPLDVVLRDFNFAYNVPVTDSSTVSESVTVRLSSPVSVSDSVTTSESVNALETGLIIVSDSTTTSESSTIRSTQLVAVSDSLSTSESLNQTLVDTLAISDSTTVSEALQLLETSFVTVSDSVTTSDTPTVSIASIANLTISVSESITTSDPVALLETSFVAISENVTTAESTSLALINLASVSDATSVSEAINQTLTDNLNVAETVGSTENVVLDEKIALAVSDQTTLTEATTAALSLSIAASESVTTSESTIIQTTSLAIVSDTVSTSDPVSVTLVSLVSLSDAVSLTDTPTVNLFTPAGATYQVAVSDTIGRTPYTIILVDGRPAIRIKGNFYTFV